MADLDAVLARHQAWRDDHPASLEHAAASAMDVPKLCAELSRAESEVAAVTRECATYRAERRELSATNIALAEEAAREKTLRIAAERNGLDLSRRLAIAEAQLAAYGPMETATRPQDGRTPVPGGPTASEPLPGPQTAAQTITPTEPA